MHVNRALGSAQVDRVLQPVEIPEEILIVLEQDLDAAHDLRRVNGVLAPHVLVQDADELDVHRTRLSLLEVLKKRTTVQLGKTVSDRVTPLEDLEFSEAWHAVLSLTVEYQTEN